MVLLDRIKHQNQPNLTNGKRTFLEFLGFTVKGVHVCMYAYNRPCTDQEFANFRGISEMAMSLDPFQHICVFFMIIISFNAQAALQQFLDSSREEI